MVLDKVAVHWIQYYTPTDRIASFEFTQRFGSLNISRITPKPQKRLPSAHLIKEQITQGKRYRHDTLSAHGTFTQTSRQQN